MKELSRMLLHYKRKDVQEAMLDSAQNREVGTRYGDKGFGKRPDIIAYENDIISAVKKGATSFHISEEIWVNPMQLNTGMKRNELDDLRQGWDLVLDIDCPYWFFSKLTTHLFIKALKKHNITSISCKFSGNKGFHIGIPFETFPEEVNNQPIKNWFPEGPKKIAEYLLFYIGEELIKAKDDKIIFDDKITYTIKELSKELSLEEADLIHTQRCKNCHNPVEKKQETKYEYVCSGCGTRKVFDKKQKIMVCEKCKKIMDQYEHKKNKCETCGSLEFEEHTVFNPLSVVDVDTLLISSRHMYRAPYSMHEKSGLVSIPVNPDKVLEFEKKQASSDNLKISKSKFLDNTHVKKNEALGLMLNAFDYGKEETRYKIVYDESSKRDKKTQRDFEEITEAIPVELFPPCILKILEGLEDGRKRSLFILSNFLTAVGWNYNSIEEALLEWNKKNKEGLREGLIRGQVRYHKQKNKKILPPNCRSYYQDFQVCNPDSTCEKIKNPVQYSKRKIYFLQDKKNKGRQRLTEEQKEMRRKHRENIKQKNENKA